MDGIERGSTDDDEFAVFVRAHERRLWQAVTPIAGPDAATDAVAHAFAVAWRRWPDVRTMENPAGYVYRIAANEARPRRRSLRRARFDRPDQARIPDVEPELTRALAELSEQQRAVVLLVVAWEWTQAEVAELLDLSPSTVRNHLYRAIGRLRKELEVEIDV